MVKSRIQQLISRVVPSSWAASMEEESRQWMVRCQKCGYERSIWELGGVRWKAAGTKWMLGRCPNCGKLGWHKVYHKPKSESPPGA
jgi:hypothetical protein